MSEPCCSIARAYIARIEHLEEELERLRAQLDHGGLQVPTEWCLAPQEAIMAELLATRGYVHRESALAAFEGAKRNADGRSAGLVGVIVCRLRAKLGDFGWVIPKARASTWCILLDQRAAFRAALTGEGDIAHPALSKGRGARYAGTSPKTDR